MNTAALLPSPAVPARPQRGALAVSDAPAQASAPEDDFAAALQSSSDVDADMDADVDADALLPAAGDAAPVLSGSADAPPESLDPQSAYALAALGLLMPPPVQPALPVQQSLPASGQPAAAEAPAADALPATVPALAATATPARAPTAAVEPATAGSERAERAPMALQDAPSAAVATLAGQAARSLDAVAPEDAPAVDAALSAQKKADAPTTGQDGATEPDLSAPAAVVPAATSARLTTATGAVATPAPTVVLKGEATQWQQPLLQALGDRLQLQIAARSDQAVIRLEPPLLGQVEIAIRQQAGDLQVRIAASHDEVTRQIQQVSDQLRQGLVQRHSGEVSVQVVQAGAGSREAEARGSAQQQAARDGQQQAREEQRQQQRPGRGLGDEGMAGFAADFAAVKA